MKNPSILLLACVALALPGVSVHAGEADRWDPQLGILYRSLSDTAISADGTRVAWVVREPRIEGEDSKFVDQIWVADSDGTSAGGRQFTRGDESSSSPAFSPDGRWLAFLAARGDSSDEPKAQVWKLSMSGGEAEKLTDAEAGVTSFQWSPDGTKIAYLSPDPQSEEEKTAEKEKTDVILVDRDFKFSHLYSIPAESTGKPVEATRLTEGDFHLTDFDWSPDGSRLVFAFAPDPRINTTGTQQDLAWVLSSGGDVRPLVRRDGVDGTPHYSPDGRSIAFTSHGGRVERVGLADLWLIDADGGTPRALPHTPDRQASIVAWAPDGASLIVSEAEHTRRGTLRVGIATGEVNDLPTSAPFREGVTSSPALDATGNTVAWVWQSSDEPQEVYVVAPDDPAPRRISAANQDVPRPPMGATELLSWRSRDDRWEIEGLLTYPVGYRRGDRVPLILNVHGGPSGVFSETFTGSSSIYQIQYFAQLGYAVLRPNPRGSSGYGKDFRYDNIEDWGFGDFDDLMAGVDHVIGLGVADEENLFLMGWSYGGYMTSFAVTRTDRFRAASMGAGLPNLVSMVTTTDIPDYLTQHMGGEFWDDYETYERHSAIYRIANVVTPTQVIHGARDLRVPFTQGQEFYVALQRRGIPTEMIVYPRTPHGPREPKLLMDVSPRIAKWFALHGGLPLPVEDPSPTEAAQATAGGQ